MEAILGEVPDIACHDAIGMGRHCDLDEHSIGGVWQVHCEHAGQYGFAVGFDVLQDGVNPLSVETKTGPCQHIPVLGKDSLIETDGDSPG